MCNHFLQKPVCLLLGLFYSEIFRFWRKMLCCRISCYSCYSPSSICDKNYRKYTVKKYIIPGRCLFKLISFISFGFGCLWVVMGGCWLVVDGRWLVLRGCWLVLGGCWLVVGGCWLVVGRCWLVEGDCGWLLAGCGWSWVVVGGCWLVVGGCLF